MKQQQQQQQLIKGASCWAPRGCTKLILPAKLIVTFLIIISNIAILLSSTVHTYELSSSSSSISLDASGAQQDLGSTDSLLGFVDANYLSAVSPDVINESSVSSNLGSLESAAQVQQQQEEISDYNSLSSSIKPIKSRKQAEALDWWTKLTNNSLNKKKQAQTKNNQRSTATTSATPLPVYREQPLSQNAIVTIRNQLLAIRDKHRLLTTKSVAQLMTLDKRLIESYKLCLKRKMPLYAGMLYRTRDFVVSLAREVKHERQVLEAIAKQTQRVLRQKISNRTLVKEYNRLTSSSSSSSSSIQLEKQTISQQQLHHLSGAQVAGSSSSSSSQMARDGDQVVVDFDDDNTGDSATTDNTKRTKRSKRSITDLTPQLSNLDHHNKLSARPFSSLRNSKLGSTSHEQQDSVQVTDSPFDKHSKLNTKGNSNNQKLQLSGTEVNSIFRSRGHVENNLLGGGGDNYDQHLYSTFDSTHDLDQHQLSSGSVPTTSTTTTTTMPTTTTTEVASKLQKNRYTVHINEVNLKRELVKTQALIDRINSSTHELTGVIDDIVHLFKLTTDINRQQTRKNGLSASGKINNGKHHQGSGGSMLMDFATGMDQKRAKKMLKSPFKVFFERYGKLTMSNPAMTSSNTMGDNLRTNNPPSDNSNSNNPTTTNNLLDINTNNFPELKPLFDQSSLTTYKDPLDLELGFDSPTIIQT